MSFFIGWCHSGSCELGVIPMVGLHWHYWDGTDVNAIISNAKQYDAYEEAEAVLAEILLIHPERSGEMTIESMTHYRGGVMYSGGGSE